jgi:hypothetical protein
VTVLIRSGDVTVERMAIFPGHAKAESGEPGRIIQLVVASGEVRVAGTGEPALLSSGASTALFSKDSVRLENTGQGTAVVIRITCESAA